MTDYRGYLSRHIPRIRELHEQGRNTGEIARKLYQLGVRTNGTMTREQQIAGLRALVAYVLAREGLHTPRKRPRRVMPWEETPTP